MPGEDQTPENKEENSQPLIFQDASGKEHKALRFNEKLFEGKEEDFSVGKILRAVILGDKKGLNEIELKSASEGIGAAGGFLISETVSARLVDLARNQMCVMKAGGATIDMPTPEMVLVKQSQDPTAEFIAEGGEVTESKWAIEPISLKAMDVAVLCRASKNLLEDAVNAGPAIERAMSAAIALAVDKCSLLGDGVNSPRGIAHADDVHEISMGANGLALSDYSDFSEACEKIAESNGIATSVIYAPRTHFSLDRLVSATEKQPLIPPQSFQDLKKYFTNQVPVDDVQGTCSTASRAFVGDFKQLIFGVRKNVELEITTTGGEKTFAKIQALIRARMRFDIGILRPTHFCIVKGIKV